MVCDEVCTAVMAFDWGAANRKEKLLFFGLGGRVYKLVFVTHETCPMKK